MVMDDVLNGFSRVSSPTIYWKSRRKSSCNGNLFPAASGRKLEVSEDSGNKESKIKSGEASSVLSERGKALFEPLEAVKKKRPSDSGECLLPTEIDGLNQQLDEDIFTMSTAPAIPA
ncbi:hypothetical protein E2542_SST25414 [Spatholobus suberectus]|nr:hypothetical protein E2542_SST25414 [Spatholobus suberectus]